VFNDLASFSSATFEGRAGFEDTRFADVTFVGAFFIGRAAFERASFRGSATFNSATFEGAAAFTGVDFRDRATFDVTSFDAGTSFSGARFGQGASFLAADFHAPITGKDEVEQPAASFDQASSSANLDFTFATFNSAPKKADEVAIFDGLVSGRSLLLGRAEFQDEDNVTMNRLQVADLVLAVDAVRLIRNSDDRQDVLKAIEDSAKARGDLGIANDAHYGARALRSTEFGPVLRAADTVFYRWIAGYFVKPFRPLLLFVALVALVALVSVLRKRAADDAPRPSRLRRWGGHCSRFLTCLLDTFALAGRRGTGNREEPVPLTVRAQVIVYRLLLVCALIGLANSNPTLRQMVDTLL
jgi:hypothetical protein